MILRLSEALGELSREKEEDAINDRLALSEAEIELLVKSAGDWNQVKNNYLSYPNLMGVILEYRKREVCKIVGQVYESNEQFDKLDMVVGNAIVRNNPTEMVAAGSNDPTSDYDVTFSAGAGNEKLEILAVREFNKLFRNKWILESGIVFDTNVYTSGHMRSAAFKGDGEKLKLINNLSKKLDKILNENTLEYPEKRDEINDLVAKINGLGNEGTPIKLAQLEVNNVKRFSQQIIDLQNNLVKKVGQQYKDSKESYGAGEEFDELAMVMSLVHMKEFWGQKPDGAEQHPDGANWTHFEKRLGGEKVPENGQAVPETVKEVKNNDLLKEVDKIHKELVEERQEKMKELENDPKLAKNKKNIEMMANNLLYEKYLQEVSEKRSEVQELDPNASNAVVKQKKLELQGLQSKALFFANEAYMTAISAEQVVLNQQLELGLELPMAQYLASIIEQTTFVGEQIAHITGNNKHGRALWKTSKYINRIVDAINTISELAAKVSETTETGEAVPSEAGKAVLSEDIMTKVRDLKDWGKQLETIKRDSDRKEKDKKRTPKEKDKDAKNVARKVPDLLGRDITGLATKILNLVSDVTLNVQDYLESEKTKNQ